MGRFCGDRSQARPTGSEMQPENLVLAMRQSGSLTCFRRETQATMQWLTTLFLTPSVLRPWQPQPSMLYKQVIKDANEYVAQQHFVISLLQPNLFAFYQPWLKGYNGQDDAISGELAAHLCSSIRRDSG